MKAVIVAAGKSTRLYPITLDIPKPLLEINGIPIVKHSILNLRRAQIKDIGVVVGYLKEKFKKILNEKITLLYNDRYNSTNDMVSLWCAKEFVKGQSFIYLHGDLIYHPGILKNCLNAKGDIVLTVDKKSCDEEDMKVVVKKGLLVKSDKDIPLSDAYGEWVGIAKFSETGGKLLFNEIDAILQEGRPDVYDTYAFNALARKGCKINICHTNHLPWIEVDFEKELKIAESISIKISEKRGKIV